MWRLLLIIAVIIVIYFVVTSSVGEHYFDDVSDSVTDNIAGISQWSEKQKIQNLLDNIEPVISAMKDYQQDYMEKVFIDKASVKRFYTQYCIQQDKNPYIYGNNLQIVCGEIQKSSVLAR